MVDTSIAYLTISMDLGLLFWDIIRPLMVSEKAMQEGEAPKFVRRLLYICFYFTGLSFLGTKHPSITSLNSAAMTIMALYVFIVWNVIFVKCRKVFFFAFNRTTKLLFPLITGINKHLMAFLWLKRPVIE